MSTKIDELFATLRGLISDQSRDLAMAMAELHSVAQQRDKALTERDSTRQSLRAAEQDVAETEGINSDLRCINKRLVAGLAAAMERADTAEAILRATA
jgi:hypothetical protein